ncbi:MAG: metal ABC transporter permease [Desulfovibrionales bacterium]
MIEAFSFGFMQNALAAAILASIACGVIGSLVVVNRLVFLSGGIAHAAYGGVGLALFLGLPVLPCTLGFTLAATSAAAAVMHKRSVRSDTLIGVLWAAGMAFGILLLDFTPGYNVDLISYLFGSILAVPGADLKIMAVMLGLVVGTVVLLYNQFLSLSLDSEFSKSRGVNAQLLHIVLLCLIAVTVVLVIRVVGLILVIALLTIPAYMAERFSPSLGRMMVAASLLSVGFCIAGLWAAYFFNLTSGASIIAVATLCFFVFSLIEGTWKKQKWRSRDRSTL